MDGESSPTLHKHTGNYSALWKSYCDLSLLVDLANEIFPCSPPGVVVQDDVVYLGEASEMKIQVKGGFMS